MSVEPYVLPIALNESSLTPAAHSFVLEQLNLIADAVSKDKKLEVPLRARDWSFEKENSSFIFDVFLDCGDHLAAPDMDTCAAFHSILLDAEFVNSLPDHVELRVGSAGAECALRRSEDFLPFEGQVVWVQSWKGKSGEYLLGEVNTELHSIELSEALGAKNAQFTTMKISDIKKAKALYFHPESKKFRLKESHKKRDFRPKKERLIDALESSTKEKF